MLHPLLSRFASDEFIAAYAFISTPSALYRALDKSVDVGKLRAALDADEVSEKSLKDYATELLAHLRKGEPFPFDVAIAAFAIALAPRKTAFANEFIDDLAALRLAEMSMSPRVARECGKHRLDAAKIDQHRIPPTTSFPIVQLPLPDRANA